ncbi:hypothetical protein C2G38_1367794 [Gigaspora rosea]|uniref:BTB domain-containing protein n=1 Tax=Gigaspora rosea TaxID=44941 RepID=A0A397V7Y8_9GLOM|nr:hypothetical protein C2G38_1367794 [Gigaspora rosea]
MDMKIFKKLSNDLTKLLESGRDYNVLIEVGQMPSHQIFKAHSIILHSRCLYFREKLSKTVYDEYDVKKISVTNISVVIFEIIINIILFDKIDAPTVLDLLTAANEFGLEELFDTIQQHLIKNHAPWMRNNFVRIHKISFKNEKFKYLQNFCNDIIDNYPSIIFDSEDYVDLSENILVSLLKHDNLNVDEGKIWDHVIRWGIAQNSNLDPDPKRWSNENFLTLKNTIGNCMPHIRYFHINNEDIIDKLYPYQQIFEPNLWRDILIKLSASNRVIASTILSPREVQNDNSFYSMRKKARECFNQGKFLDAFELYEKILVNSQHSTQDLISASTWDLPDRTFTTEESKDLIIILYKNTILSSLKLNLYFFDCSFEILAEALYKNTTLTSLEINFPESEFEILENILCNNITLNSLTLKYFEFKPDSMRKLLDALCKNKFTTLSFLSLESCVNFSFMTTEFKKKCDDNIRNWYIFEDELIDALSMNTTLTSLNLKDTCLNCDKGKAIANALCKNTTLISLNLENNYLGLEAAKAFADVLCKNATLTYLNLSNALLDISDYEDNNEDDKNDTNVGLEEIKAFADALCKNITLTSLYISKNELGLNGGKAMADALCKNTVLTFLDISENKIGPDGGKTLADALCVNTTLTSLNLRNNHLGLEVVKAFAEVLCKNTTLTYLNLAYNIGYDNSNNNDNNFGSEGGKALADALCKNTVLTFLDISENKIGPDGVKALADALCKNTTLTSLILRDNQLESEGGIALAEALCNNTTLTSLDISNCQLGSEGGKALSNALCKNATLTSLDLQGNELGPEGGKAFAEAICKNTMLISLSLQNNQLGSEGLKAFAEAICKNTKLTSLNFRNNHFESEEIKAFEESIYNNTTLSYWDLEDDEEEEEEY